MRSNFTGKLARPSRLGCNARVPGLDPSGEKYHQSYFWRNDIFVRKVHTHSSVGKQNLMTVFRMCCKVGKLDKVEGKDVS